MVSGPGALTRRVWHRRRELLLAGLSALLTLVGAELAMRAAGYWYLRRLVADVHGRTGAPGQRAVILAIGESTTVGVGVARAESYPRQLESRLRERYRTQALDVLLPVQVGQNSSQVLNRLQAHLDLHAPRLVILMCGVNNEWSLAESRIADYLPEDEWHTHRMRLAARLDGLRVFKLARFAYLTATSQARPLADPALLGVPEMVPFPPPSETLDFAAHHRAAFVAMWRHDLTLMIGQVRRRGAKVLLMTYPNYDFSYLKSEEFVRLANVEQVPLVRNDLSFRALIAAGRAREVLLADGGHPTARGYAIVAENALAAIRELDLLGLEAVGRSRSPGTSVDSRR